VNTSASGLAQKIGEVGLALGIGSLTVEEQATTFATLANDGQYVTPHVIEQITENQNGTTVNVPLKITRRQVLTPAQAADVDFALSFDTSPGGTAFPNGVLNPNRPTIGKTGTTDDEQSAFFLGAIPQYSFAVGMFTNEQNGQPGGQSLGILPSVNAQPAGNGGNWPATIWQTYMQNEFANLPIDPLPTPDYTGFSMWDQVPPQPKPKPKPNPCVPGHRHFGLCPPTGLPTPNPNPTIPTPPFGGGILGANAVGAVLGQNYSVQTDVSSSSEFVIVVGLIATLTLLLMAVAGLGVLNTVVLQTRERVHDLGVFKAIGMTPRQTMAVVVCSVAGIGLVAGLIAIPAGIALHHYVLPVMGHAAQTDVPASILSVYQPWELVLLALSGLVIAVAGALLPAGWAARTRTAFALRAE